MKTTEQLQDEIDSLMKILEFKEQIITVMYNDLLALGINFDFDSVDKRHSELQLLFEKTFGTE